MYPMLFSYGFLKITTYGLMIALGFFIATQLITRDAKRIGLDEPLVVDMIFQSFTVGMVGARLLFVLLSWRYYLFNPFKIFAIWEGGSVFLGGLVTGVGYLLWFCKRKKLSIPMILDLTTPSVVLAHAIGRLGCLGAGCCYGKPTSMPWGVLLTSDIVPQYLHHTPLHPTQLYESFALLGLFAAMRFTYLTISLPQKRTGLIPMIYLLIYPIIRFVVELFRGDQERGFVVQNLLSTSQFISLVLFSIGLSVLARRTLKTKKTS